MDDKYTADSFAADLKGGPSAWPGGYPKFFVTADGGCLCFPCAKKEKRTIRSAIRRNDRTGGWQVIGCDINWEDPSLFCDNCSKRIESAYAEDDAANEARENPARAKARRNASCRKNPTTYARKLPAPFNRFTARDWEHARRIAYQLQMESYGDAYVEEVFSTGYAAVGFDDEGAYLEAQHERLPHAEWPAAPRPRASLKSVKRSKRPAGSRRTRKVNRRPNPTRTRRNPHAPSGFRRGQRVQLHPGTDRWIMGDRYGEVTAANTRGGKVRVLLDRSGKSLLFSPDRLIPID